MIRAIVFDFDGVIGDTFNINFGLAKEFYQSVTEQQFRDHHNGNVFENPTIKFTDEETELYFKKQKVLFAKKHLFPLKRVLHKLHAEFQLFIISSGEDKNIQAFLKLDDYHTYFEKIYGRFTHKSKIEKFRLLFVEFGIQHNECLFVTDTVGDLKEAHELDIKTIAVTWGFHDKEFLEQHEPKRIVHTPEELLAAIEEMSAE